MYYGNVYNLDLKVRGRFLRKYLGEAQKDRTKPVMKMCRSWKLVRAQG